MILLVFPSWSQNSCHSSKHYMLTPYLEVGSRGQYESRQFLIKCLFFIKSEKMFSGRFLRHTGYHTHTLEWYAEVKRSPADPWTKLGFYWQERSRGQVTIVIPTLPICPLTSLSKDHRILNFDSQVGSAALGGFSVFSEASFGLFPFSSDTITGHSSPVAL